MNGTLNKLTSVEDLEPLPGRPTYDGALALAVVLLADVPRHYAYVRVLLPLYFKANELPAMRTRAVYTHDSARYIVLDALEVEPEAQSKRLSVRFLQSPNEIESP